MLAFEEEQKKGLEDLLENGRLNGLPDLEILDHDAIMEIEPNVNPEVKYALYCKGAGVCSPYEMPSLWPKTQWPTVWSSTLKPR